MSDTFIPAPDNFIKFIPEQESDWLQEHETNAFLLLIHIAKVARKTEKLDDGLKFGDALIGENETPKKCGLTPKEFRNAKEKLESLGYITEVYNQKWDQPRYIDKCKKLLEIPKTQKRAIKRAIFCSVVNLCNTRVFDINRKSRGDQKGERGTNDGRTKGDEQRKIDVRESIVVDNKTTTSQSPCIVPFPAPCFSQNISKSSTFDILSDVELGDASYVAQVPAPKNLAIFDCLKALPIPEKDKIYLTQKFAGKEDKVNLAVKAALKSPRDSITAYIVSVASKENLKITLSPEERIAENQKFCHEIESLYHSENWKFEVLGQYALLSPKLGAGKSYDLKYSEHGFKEQLKNLMMKCGFREQVLSKS